MQPKTIIKLRIVLMVPVLCTALALLAGSPRAQTIHPPTVEQQASLEKFLRSYLGHPYAPFEKEEPTRYSAAFVDLKDASGYEVIVYLTGRAWCGSGGCTTLVLAPKDSSYRLVSRLTITWPPVRVLARKSHGWHDIGVWAQGGGVQPGYEADLYFDGKTYRGRDAATLRPSKSLARRVLPGQTVISSTAVQEAKRVYP